MLFRSYEFPEDIEQRRLESEFQDINDNPSVHGILLFRPLPKHLDGEVLRRAIDPRKDVDGMSPLSAAKVFAGEDDGFYFVSAVLRGD